MKLKQFFKKEERSINNFKGRNLKSLNRFLRDLKTSQIELRLCLEKVVANQKLEKDFLKIIRRYNGYLRKLDLGGEGRFGLENALRGCAEIAHKPHTDINLPRQLPENQSLKSKMVPKVRFPKGSNNLMIS